MEKSYSEGLASHAGPEPCGVTREGVPEASVGVRAGRVLSREIWLVPGADVVRTIGRPHLVRRYGKTYQGPARSETSSMCGSSSRENREIPGSPAVDGAAGRAGKSEDVIQR